MAKMNRKSERAAWTRFVETGIQPAVPETKDEPQGSIPKFLIHKQSKSGAGFARKNAAARISSTNR